MFDMVFLFSFLAKIDRRLYVVLRLRRGLSSERIKVCVATLGVIHPTPVMDDCFSAWWVVETNKFVW